MVTSEGMEIDENGRTNNCSAVGYKIPNITSIPRKMTVNILTNHNVKTAFNSSKVFIGFEFTIEDYFLFL